MTRVKINDKRMLRLLDTGRSQAEAGRIMGVSRQAVSQRLQELRGKTTRCIVARNTKEIVNSNLDTIGQLRKINNKANQLLDELQDDPNTAIRIMAEIRGQLKLQLDIFEILYSVQAAQEFQKEVLNTIGEADDETRQNIINRLNQKRAIRSAVQWA
jgi:predicted transcriptional regulator